MTRMRGRQAVGSWITWAIALMLTVAILFGGGGAEGPANNGIIYAASAILLLSLGAAHASGSRPLPREAMVPLWLLAAVLLVGCIQLIPVPPAIWRSLPGRELAISSLALVSADHSWRPLSLDPEATRRALAALLLPAVMIVAVLGATCREVILLLRILLACASFSALLGVLQAAAGYPDWLMPYQGAADLPTGIFANINHQASFLLAAIVAVGLYVRLSPVNLVRGWLPGFNLAWFLLPVLAAMVAATGSRAGLVLLILAVPSSLLIGLLRPSRLAWFAAAVGAMALATLVLALSMSGELLAGGHGLFTDARRAAIYPDVLFTLQQYWPWGSGLGTFVPVFAANENLDLAGNEFVNHAHNDLFELLIETGFAGAALLLIAAGAIVARLVAVHRSGWPSNRQGVALCAGILIISLQLLHSLVDYPLRMASIAAVTAIALGLVYAPLPDQRPAPVRSRMPSRWIYVGSAILALMFAGQVVRIFAAQAAVRNKDGEASLAIRPQNGAGLALAAEKQLAGELNEAARSSAARAIGQAPLSARAVRVLAIAEDVDRRGGMAAWRVASALGWRDGPTQYWAMQQALANREYETAAIRADAFLRTAYGGLRDRVGGVRILSSNDAFRRELVRRMQLSPGWMESFFRVTAETPAPQLIGAKMALQDLAAAASPASPEDTGRVLRVLVQRKQLSDAVRLYVSVHPDGAEAMRNLSFDKPASYYLDQNNPFDWAFKSKAGSVTGVEQSGSRRVLVVGTNGRNRHQHAVKYAGLSPGNYRLRYEMRGSPESPEIFAIAVSCAQDMRPLGTGSSHHLGGDGFEPREIRFSVPTNCPAILFSIESNWTDRASEAEFADLSLDAL